MSKDRLGDRLRDKEKAEEDRYFAEQDKAKLDAIREGTEAGEVACDCPRCGETLASQDREGVTIDVCLSCGGVWLDKGEMETLIERESESWMSSWFRSILASHG